MEISTQQATIRTAQVEIKALTVNGKQVTQALYRQLPDEDIIDRLTGNMRGDIWGTINYHTSRCQYLQWPHTHFIWQLNDTLRRGDVYQADIPGQKGWVWVTSHASERLHSTRSAELAVVQCQNLTSIIEAAEQLFIAV